MSMNYFTIDTEIVYHLSSQTGLLDWAANSSR